MVLLHYCDGHAEDTMPDMGMARSFGGVGSFSACGPAAPGYVLRLLDS